MLPSLPSLLQPLAHRVVDQHIQAAKLLGHLLEHALNVLALQAQRAQRAQRAQHSGHSTAGTAGGVT